ncbi:MAG TPA: N-acetylmuramoyl-L-alanine amidase [Bryobacteraceae bacterium]|nr:N-acetylmuramoyl-L-alanine amidase [Bryobacteraceae bacterium]
MIRRIHWAAAMFSILPVSAATNSGIIQVTGLRFWSHPGSTRIIIDVSGTAEYHSDRAHNPERIFFDISRARPWINHKRIASREINDTLVTRVRVAETAPGTTRVVLDLTGKDEYTVSTLTAPDRIVIEVTPPGSAKPQTESAAPVMETSAAAPARTPVLPSERYVASARTRRAPKAFVPPVMPQPVIHLITPPETDLAAKSEWDTIAFNQIPDNWISLANVRAAHRTAVAASVQPVPPAADYAPPALPAKAPFINTTTKVLPALHRAEPIGTAKASTDASASLTRALGLKINRIVIDAGHGGHDDGTIGPNGVLEKDVVLDVALRLATLVQTKLGAEVVLTRSDDTFVPLTERTAIANQYKADLFLSIHANSSPAPSVAGTETFLLNLNSSPGAISVAARENAGSDKSVGELRDLLQSIAQNDKIAESTTFATDIQNAIFAQAAKGNGAARDRGVKKAPFVVLIGARMPSVLAEIGFLSNTKDESNLGKGEYRQKVAESLYRGIERYSQSLSHFEVTASAAAPQKGSGYTRAASK